MKNFVLGLAALTTGLVAGLYFAFEVAVNPAFARLPDAEYLRAMQEINGAILNPVFAASFFGAPLLLLLSTVLAARPPRGRRLGMVAAATAVFWVGSLGVTVAVNIPLNERLAAVPVQAAPAGRAAEARRQFAPAWNRWHRVRTLASVLALALVVGACLAPAPAAPPPEG